MGTPPDCSGVRGCRWPRCPHGLPRHRRAVPLLGECGPSALPLGSAGVFEVRRAPPRTSDAAPSAYSGRRGAVAAAAPEPRFFFRTNPPERLRDFPTRGWILSLAREEGNREEEGGDTRSITRPGLCGWRLCGSFSWLRRLPCKHFGEPIGEFECELLSVGRATLKRGALLEAERESAHPRGFPGRPVRGRGQPAPLCSLQLFHSL